MTKKTTALNEQELENVTGGASRGDIQSGQNQAQFTGGVRVAAGDVNGDSTAAVITFSDLIVSSYQSSGSAG